MLEGLSPTECPCVKPVVRANGSRWVGRSFENVAKVS